MSRDRVKSIQKALSKLTHERIVNSQSIGLGLTISKLLCDKLNGQIKIDSEESRGTTMTIKIKLSNTRSKLSQMFDELQINDENCRMIDMNKYRG